MSGTIVNEVGDHIQPDLISQLDIEARVSESFPLPTGETLIFGRNNDSKRMYKFGNADGATISNAIDELRDNSEDAGCSKTETNYDAEKRIFTHDDDGSGMGIITLQEFSNLDSHNPTRDDISTSGQHGIGGPRSLTCLARPEFDDNFKVIKDSSWTVYTKQKGTNKAFSLTCNYIKLNDNNKYTDCFTSKEYDDEDLDVSYTKIRVPIVNDIIHNELLSIQENKSINNLKDNIYIKSAMTWNKPSKINGRDIALLPNFFNLSDEFISTEYKLYLYYCYNDNMFYPIRIDKVYGSGNEQLGWVNCKKKSYDRDLSDEQSNKQVYADLPDAVATLKLSINKNRFHIAPNKKGIQACINPETNPDPELVEYIHEYLDLETLPEPETKEYSAFSINVVDTFFKDINVFMKTSAYTRCLGTLPFKRGKGYKGTDLTLRHELHSIKKNLTITKSVDKYLKFSREIKSNIDDKLVPKSLLIAINHCIYDFKSKVIQSKIKNPLKEKAPKPIVPSKKEYVHKNKICLIFEGAKEFGPEIFLHDDDELCILDNSEVVTELSTDPINIDMVKSNKYIKAFISKKEGKYTVEQKFVKTMIYGNGSGRSPIEDLLHLELSKIPGVSVADGGFKVLLSSYEQFITKFNSVCRPHLSIG